MARTPMVTRTIKSTQVTALCLNIETAEPFNKTITIPRTIENEKKLIAKCREIIDNENKNEKFVTIVDTNVVEALYGMTEVEFIEKAKKLDPRKVNTETDDSATAETNGGDN